MKKLTKFIIALLIVSTVMLTASYIFLRINGKKIITEKLSLALQKKVTIGDIVFYFPLTLYIKNLQIEDCLKTGEAKISLSLFGLLNRDVYFSTFHLIEPVIFLKKTKDNRFSFGEIPQEIAVGSDSSIAQPMSPPGSDIKAIIKEVGKKTHRLQFLVGRLIIQNGQVKFVDYSMEGEPFRFTVDKINLKAQKIGYPVKRMNTKFDLSALIVSLNPDLPKGKLEGNGWINFGKKDMDAKIQIHNLDGSIFRPFYKDFLNQDVRGVTVDLSTDLSSRDNDMLVKGELAIKSHAVKIPAQDKDSFSVKDFILNGLAASGTELVTHFQFKTKMNSFKIDSIPFSGTVRQTKTDEKKEVVPAADGQSI